MKTRNLNLAKMALYLFLGFSITLVSCSGEDGKDGINGEIGPQGPAGQDGADGQDGANGQDGNANVVVSDWMQFAFDTTGGGDPATWGEMYFEDEDIPEVDINAFVETGGVVMFYYKASVPDGSFTYPLPYQSVAVSMTTYMASFENTITGLVLRVEANDVSFYETLTDNHSFKYVLVPANVAEETGIADKMPESFGEAAALLGLD